MPKRKGSTKRVEQRDNLVTIVQLDLFELLEEELYKPDQINEDCAASIPASSIPKSNRRRPQPARLILDACMWLWNCVTSLFGLGVWVNVYTISRGFGGRENGGWYYLKYDCVLSKQVGIWEADPIRLHLLKEYRMSHKWGDLYAKRGGQDVVVRIEWRRAASKTRCKPTVGETGVYTFPYSLVHKTI